MEGIIMLGFIIGISAAALDRAFGMRAMIGSVFLATAGAMEGKLIAAFLREMNIVNSGLFVALSIVIGAITLLGVKKLCFPNKQNSFQTEL